MDAIFFIQPLPAINARRQNEVFQPIKLITGNASVKRKQQLRLNAAEHRFIAPIMQHRLQRGADELDQRMMNGRVPLIKEIGDIVFLKNSFDIVAIISRIPHHNRHIAPVRSIFPYPAQHIARQQLHLGSPVCCRMQRQAA